MGDKTVTLIAGGAGFIGSHLCSKLLNLDHKVICIDNFSSGKRENIQPFEDDPDFNFLKKDITTLSSTGLPIDEIYHLASMASPSYFTEKPLDIALSNTLGTRRLLELARKKGAKMVFASTSEVYGDPEVHPQPESYNGNVNIRGPRACYDESKRFGETLTVAYQTEYGVDARTVRIFNTYGPDMRIDDSRAIPTFIRQALQDKDVTVYGDGSQTRCFCYISDTVEGIRKVMKDDYVGEVYNIGRNKEITIKRLAERIINLTHSDSEIVYKPLPEDDPTKRMPDIRKAKKQLDWDSNVTLEEGLKNTIDSFKIKLEME